MTGSVVGESTADDLEIQRYLLDLALQPLERFEGFTRIDQWLEASLRYQLNSICFALAMAQYTRTPAFSGYLAEAQRNAIAKMLDRRVWSYWALENLIGNLRWDPDPIVRDNVMYSGYLGVMIGMYETLNDDHRYDRPGALTLRWSEHRRYRYDFGSLAEAIQRNMLAGPTPLYPCEPHMIFPICNTFAINTLVMHDRLHSTALTGDLVERVGVSFERDGFLRQDGRFISGRTRFGLTFMPPATSTDAALAYWLHAAMPEQAHRTWRVVRERLMRLSDDGVEITCAPWERFDVGNYTLGDAIARVFTMSIAREMGDQEAADALERSLDERHEIARAGGARQYAGLSTLANAAHALARFTRPNGMRDLIRGVVPAAWRRGPLLAEAGYPDVLVARAVSDGEDLDLVLHPGDGPRRTTLALERLAPGRLYRLSGAAQDDLTAGPDGRGLVEVDLAGRTEVLLRPAA